MRVVRCGFVVTVSMVLWTIWCGIWVTAQESRTCSGCYEKKCTRDSDPYSCILSCDEACNDGFYEVTSDIPCVVMTTTTPSSNTSSSIAQSSSSPSTSIFSTTLVVSKTDTTEDDYESTTKDENDGGHMGINPDMFAERVFCRPCLVMHCKSCNSTILDLCSECELSYTLSQSKKACNTTDKEPPGTPGMSSAAVIGVAVGATVVVIILVVIIVVVARRVLPSSHDGSAVFFSKQDKRSDRQTALDRDHEKISEPRHSTERASTVYTPDPTVKRDETTEAQEVNQLPIAPPPPDTECPTYDSPEISGMDLMPAYQQMKYEPSHQEQAATKSDSIYNNTGGDNFTENIYANGPPQGNTYANQPVLVTGQAVDRPTPQIVMHASETNDTTAKEDVYLNDTTEQPVEEDIYVNDGNGGYVDDMIYENQRY